MTNDPEEPIVTEQQETAPVLPSLQEISFLPFNTANPFLHLLIAAIVGLFSAVPVICVTCIVDSTNCSGPIVLFTAFLAVMIQHGMSRFAYSACVERALPHGVATMLLIGQVYCAYLFFLNTAFYGATAFTAAALIAIPVCSRTVMIWISKSSNAWLCTLVAAAMLVLIFYPFHPETIFLPFHVLLTRVPWEEIQSASMFASLLYLPALLFLVSIWLCLFLFRKWTDRKSAAMISAMIAELLIWFAFVMLSQKLSYML